MYLVQNTLALSHLRNIPVKVSKYALWWWTDGTNWTHAMQLLQLQRIQSIQQDLHNALGFRSLIGSIGTCLHFSVLFPIICLQNDGDNNIGQFYSQFAVTFSHCFRDSTLFVPHISQVRRLDKPPWSRRDCYHYQIGLEWVQSWGIWLGPIGNMSFLRVNPFTFSTMLMDYQGSVDGLETASRKTSKLYQSRLMVFPFMSGEHFRFRSNVSAKSPLSSFDVRVREGCIVQGHSEYTCHFKRACMGEVPLSKYENTSPHCVRTVAAFVQYQGTVKTEQLARLVFVTIFRVVYIPQSN